MGKGREEEGKDYGICFARKRNDSRGDFHSKIVY